MNKKEIMGGRKFTSLYLFLVVSASLILLFGCSIVDESSNGIVSPSGSGSLEGRVYTGNGVGIPRSLVCMDMNRYKCTRTDESAWYVFKSVTEGTHLITAYASGYAYSSNTIRIYPNIANQHHIKLEPK